MNFDQFFISLAAIASATVVINGYVTTHILKKLTSTGKQISAWVVALLLCVIGQLKGLGILEEATWIQTVLTGLGAGLVANGIFDIAIVQMILDLIKARRPSLKKAA